ncbi:MAG: MarR family transcriptional regulator [Thermaerobacter sp.]|nr:MarR family transcriptional regulator [Thermaerobacter sp.]
MSAVEGDASLLDTWLLLMDQVRPRYLTPPVSAPGLTILRWLARRGAVTVSHVAKLAGVSPSAITQATRKLERAGYLARRRDEDDQRVVWIDLTQRGRQMVDEVRHLQRRRLREILSVLSGEERAELARLLERVADGLPAGGSGGGVAHVE